MDEIKKDLEKEIELTRLQSFSNLYMEGKKSSITRWLLASLILGVCILLLPWTQNIRARGFVTTLRQENRPQEINSVIAGRIIKWYIKEGDFVKAGDTIVQLSEIKDSYLDPQLLSRTNDQIEAKESSISQYESKVVAIDNQVDALGKGFAAKLSQLKLKVISDSMDAVAADNYFEIAEAQLNRAKVMNDSGLFSTLQVEQRVRDRQSALAKKISAENKFQNTKTEISQVYQEYTEKLYKARGDQASVKSDIAGASAEISKLTNQASNYAIRNSLYYLIAPQNGQVIKAAKSGINEIIKEGEKVAEIVPDNSSYAVEIFVPPVDVPLISKGQDVKFMFDGYPAIVFSGWPGASYGIFSGNIVAIENSVNETGRFRVLVAEDKSSKPWPKTLKIGVGASSIALLKDVPIWYELWRDINGFPPDFYEKTSDVKKKKK